MGLIQKEGWNLALARGMVIFLKKKKKTIATNKFLKPSASTWNRGGCELRVAGKYKERNKVSSRSAHSRENKNNLFNSIHRMEEYLLTDWGCCQGLRLRVNHCMKCDWHDAWQLTWWDGHDACQLTWWDWHDTCQLTWHMTRQGLGKSCTTCLMLSNHSTPPSTLFHRLQVKVRRTQKHESSPILKMERSL
jgi:hypothetical protein